MATGVARTATGISVSIARDAALVRTVRLIAAAVARRTGQDEEFVEEVRLAVGEACALMVGSDSAPELRGGGPITVRMTITDLVGAGTYDIIIDLEAVEFLDSTGLGVLVGGLKKVRAHDGSLDLVCTQERLLKIFRITGLAKVFVIHDSVGLAPGA